MSQTPVSFLGTWDSETALPTQSVRKRLEQSTAPMEPWDIELLMLTADHSATPKNPSNTNVAFEYLLVTAP
jgi:hypothetical protein